MHEVDYTQLYDFLKYNQAEVNELRAEQLARAHDPLALMENSNNPYNYPVFHQDQPSPITYMQQPQPNNNFNPQPSFNTNYMQQPMPNLEDITDPATVMNMTLVLMAKAFKLNYLTPTNNNQRISPNPHNRQIAQLGMNLGQDRQMQMVRVQNSGIQNVGNQNGLIVVPGIANQNLNPNRNGNVVAARAEGSAIRNNSNHIGCYNFKGLEEARIQLQAEEFDFMAVAGDLEEIKEVNANCILMANLQQASTSGTHTDKAPVYDSDEKLFVNTSKGRPVADSIADRLTRPTAYKFKTDCSIIPVWTHAHIHTTVSEVIKKVFIQGFRTISENQCLLQILKVTMIGRRDIIKAFKDSNRYEHVRLKISVWQSLSERRSQSNSKK
ncbi:hypothetical protein Tco_0990128 [Tanacetum coccineum]|uniref:DUF4283 domain-containing protein n=1 Tax=Tanacetum coccineum TaxID=301880 RepID=A0ABQ5EW96_9ASTR